jgi:hypothetical protein
MAQAFNRGHIAEYVYAIGVVAAFSHKGRADLAGLTKMYTGLKKKLYTKFIEYKKKSSGERIFTHTINEHNLAITLGKKQATRMALESLQYYFTKNDPQVAEIEQSALRQLYYAKKANEFMFANARRKKVSVISDGIVDQTSSKADITIQVGQNTYSVSLKTTSQNIHGTTLNAKQILEVCNKLFGPVLNPDDLEQLNPKTPKDLEKIFNIVVSNASTNGVIQDKEKFLAGLKEYATRGQQQFQIVKLAESYRQFVFDEEYDKVMQLFEYHIRLKPATGASFPYIYIEPKIEQFQFASINENNVATSMKFFAIRGKKPDKLILELGATMNLLSDKFFTDFITKEVKAHNNTFVFRESTKDENKYKGIVTNMRSGGMLGNRKTINGEEYVTLMNIAIPIIKKMMTGKTIEKV